MAEEQPLAERPDRGLGRSSLDLSDPKDLATFNRATQRWGRRFRAISDELKDEWVNQLAGAARIAYGQLTDPDNSLKAALVLSSLHGVTARLEGMNQVDELAAAKRAGEGDSSAVPQPNLKIISGIEKGDL